MDHNEWLKEREYELENCKVCGVKGIPDHAEEAGDKDHTEILYRYSDGACRMDGEYLCRTCSDWMDARMGLIEIEASMRFAHA